MNWTVILLNVFVDLVLCSMSFPMASQNLTSVHSFIRSVAAVLRSYEGRRLLGSY